MSPLHLSVRRAGRLRFSPFPRETSAEGRSRCGFTLIEVLFVIALIVGIMSIIAPAFDAMTRSGNMEAAAYEIAGALETARTYAMAYNTYTWVGFFEEDLSAPPTTPATPGVGKVVLSLVASKNGALPYDPDKLKPIESEKLLQLGKLIKVEGVHLTTFNNDAEKSVNFSDRPPASDNAARIGDTTPPTPSETPFRYPLGKEPARYMFTKVVQFSPRGEARVNNRSMKPVAEIGLTPARGNTAMTGTSNKAAVQITGIAGNVKVYRP